MYLNLSISNGTVSTKIYDKWDDFAILIQLMSSSLMTLPPMQCIYLNLVVPLEHLTH